MSEKWNFAEEEGKKIAAKCAGRLNSGRCLSCGLVLIEINDLQLCSQCTKSVMHQQYEYTKKRQKIKKFTDAPGPRGSKAVVNKMRIMKQILPIGKPVD